MSQLMHNVPELTHRSMQARRVTFNLCYSTAGKHDNKPNFFLFSDTTVCSWNSQRYLVFSYRYYIKSIVVKWAVGVEVFKLMVKDSTKYSFPLEHVCNKKFSESCRF